jgi:2-methylcitrate dehydratase PrpD
MTDPAVLGMKKQINLLADSELDVSKSLRQGVVEITTKSGAKFRKHVLYVPGMANNPMTTPEVEKKCRGLLIPVLGEVRTQKLIDKIWNLEKISNIQELRSLLS